DWRWRMLTPPRGSYPSVPLNAEGKRIANAWDPAKDEAAGEQCKSYGAANIMRVPGRLHITWQDDMTLRLDTDAGMQTRLFYFRPSQPPNGEPTWQGSRNFPTVPDGTPGHARQDRTRRTRQRQRTEGYDCQNTGRIKCIPVAAERVIGPCSDHGAD